MNAPTGAGERGPFWEGFLLGFKVAAAQTRDPRTAEPALRAVVARFLARPTAVDILADLEAAEADDQARGAGTRPATRTPEQLLRDAHLSWGLEPPDEHALIQGGRRQQQ